jgi:hypothetical protein
MTDGCIPFLDLHLDIRDGSLSTDVYLKLCYTDLCLTYTSHSPTSFKRSVVRSMVNRALTHCSSWHAFHHEISILKRILNSYCYPTDFIDSVVHDLLRKYLSDCPSERMVAPDFTFILPLQFRGQHTMRFARAVRRILPEVFPCIYTRKLHSAVKPNFERIPPPCNSCVIYSYTCTICNNSYIGMTKRHLLARVHEHSKSELFTHHATCANACPFASCFKIIYKCRDNDILRHCEAINILSRKPVLNTQLARTADVTRSNFRLV